MIDHVLLYIDNDAKALAHALKTVRDNLTDRESMRVSRFKTFVKVYAADHISGECRQYFREAVRKAPVDNEYWEGVYQHYLNKHNEGCVMEEYL